MIFKFKRLGYSMIEAVLAIAVLSIMISVGVSIVFTATDTENTNKDYFIASTLAQEGLEAMRNIYFTNILKYGSENANECAFVMPDDNLDADPDDCGSNLIEDGSYKLNRFVSSNPIRWDLILVSDADRMIQEDELDEAYRLYLEPISDIGNIDIYVSDGNSGNESKYYREIYVTSDGSNAYIEAVVTWYRSSGVISNLKLNTTLPLEF